MNDTQQIAEARRLGTEHGQAGITPYGHLGEAGTPDLMTALGETGPTTAGNHDWRTKLTAGYWISWQHAAGRDYMDPPAPDGVLTPRRFVPALAGEGIDADLETVGGPGSWPLPVGHLRDGRGWDVADAGDAGFVGPDAPMPGRLTLLVYESATENAAHQPDEEGLEFNEPLGILDGISAAEASEAIRRAWSGDYGAFAGNTIGPPPLLEDLTVYDADGKEQPRFSEQTRAYLRAVRLAPPATIAPWRTHQCPQCDQQVYGGGLVRTSAESWGPHVLSRGFVALGCSGYPVISPAALGLDPGQWEDWRGSRDAAYINHNGPGLGYQVTLFSEYVGGAAATYPEALALLRDALAALPKAPRGEEPDIYYAEHATGLIVKFPYRIAEVRADWDRPRRMQDEVWWAIVDSHVSVEAMCLLCGQTCNPHGPDDMTHGVRLASGVAEGLEEPCGGPLVPLGAPAPSVGIPYAWTDPETGARTCPACQVVIAEDYDGDGEPLTHNYADHYQREHGDR